MLKLLNFVSSRWGVNVAWRVVSMWLPLALAAAAATAAATAAWQLGRAPLLVQIAQADAKRIAAAQQSYAATVVSDNTFVAAASKDARQLENRFKNLTEKFNALTKTIPLIAANAGGGCPAGNGAADLADAHSLTAGAVWMWNSALTGTDQPSGACSLANPTETACAAATSLTLTDAWANHTINAQACAQNRLEHQQLIDFLHQRQIETEGAKR